VKLAEAIRENEVDAVPARRTGREAVPAAPKSGATAADSGDLDNTTLGIYFKQIGRISLLTREEEVKLARRVRRGDKVALEHLVAANLRFVVSVAKKYVGIGLSLEDLVSEGNLGIMRAANRFDERRGVRFLSYAVWWIKQAILQALAEQIPLVRIPLNRAGLLHRMQKAADELRKALEREPTYAEIAKAMSLSEEEVADTLELSRTYLSLEGGSDNDDDSVGLQEFLEDSSVAPPDERATRMSLRSDLATAIGELPEREAEVIRSYYGLVSGEGQTLEEIGDRFHLSRERIRQIKESAIRKMRSGSRSHALASYLS
jgi:RNA polymerase primary sigma factor